MDELSLIARLRPHLAAAGGDLVIGAGEDDAAAWLQPAGYVVATCDTAVEGVHFDLDRLEPEDAGWRALCFALGDLAAKGARPTYGLACLSVPRRWAPAVPERMYAGMAALAAEVGLSLVGGDTTRAPNDGSLSLFLLGGAAARPRPRSAVRPGWWIAVSGRLGAASPLWRRPRPRLAEGARLCARGCVCGDVSDGLLRELDKFSAAAGVGARLWLEQVPRAPGVEALGAIANGEEVELVCAGPPALEAGSELTVVGEFTDPGPVVVLGPGGAAVPVTRRGYDHLA